jgi:hypothetical protein
MEDFFGKIGEGLKNAGDSVVRQARILEVKSQIRGKLQSLGFTVYKAKRSGKEADVDRTISELNELYTRLEALREEGQIP